MTQVQLQASFSWANLNRLHQDHNFVGSHGIRNALTWKDHWRKEIWSNLLLLLFSKELRITKLFIGLNQNKTRELEGEVEFICDLSKDK